MLHISVAGTRRRNHYGTYTHIIYQEETAMEEKHLALMIQRQIKKYGDKKALFSKNADGWHGTSWNEMGNTINAVSKGLLEFGLQKGDRVAIYSPNRPEWTICDYGILGIEGVTVPIYATNISPQAEYIINNAEIQILFVGGEFQYENAKLFFGANKFLKKIIVFDETVSIDATGDIMHFSEFLRIGRESKKDEQVREALAQASSEDLATIIYTSGTTGDPKGVMLTHANFFSQVESLNPRFDLGENDIELCFLPLSHAYQKSSCYWVQSNGATIYYCEDPKKILEYFQEAKPTYMVGVPRLYEKMYSAIHERLQQASGLKQKMFHWAVETGKRYNYKKFRNAFIGLILAMKYRIAYKLVLGKIGALLGGRLNFFSAGGAPLSHEIEEFFFAAGIFIAQGYGLTETSPVITANCPASFRFGSVGTPLSICTVKIAEDGEILVKGSNVTQGYYKKAEQTAEAFTQDGWFKTGDIGRLDDEGFLYITDRKKDIIVTANGKNVAPQNIESMIGKDFYIEQIAIIGDRRKYLSALIVPSFEALEEYARSKEISFTSRDDLIKNIQIIDFYRQRIDSHSAELANYERIVEFTLMSREFTQEAGEITPTMKIKRRGIEKNYKDIIEKMYH